MATLLCDATALYQDVSNLQPSDNIGGEGGIRTPEGFNPLPVFKTGAFNRSATSPKTRTSQPSNHDRYFTQQTRLLRIKGKHPQSLCRLLQIYDNFEGKRVSD